MIAPCSKGISVRQRVGVARRHADELGVAAVAVLADHLAGRAELLAARAAVDALAAGDEVVQADAVADARRRHAGADRGDDAGDFVAERERVAGGADAGTVVRVRVADAGGLDAHEQFAGAWRGRVEHRVLAAAGPAPRGGRRGTSVVVSAYRHLTEGPHPFIFVKGTHPFTNMKGCVPSNSHEAGGPRAGALPPAIRAKRAVPRMGCGKAPATLFAAAASIEYRHPGRRS